jgi:putative ABC transport system permease protein
MQGLLQDIRFALRQLRRNPGFFVLAALTLAIAIGANTAIFSVVEAFLIRKPGVPDPDRLLVISSVNLAGDERSLVSAPDFIDWRSQSTSFAGMAAAAYEDFTLSKDHNPDRVSGARVSDDFFKVMRVRPAMGRAFAPSEPDSVVVISDALWRSRFGGASDVLGRTVKVNGVAHTVIGVMPPHFRNWEFLADLWVPLRFSARERAQSARSTRSFGLVGALGLAQVMESLLYQIPPRDPATYLSVGAILATVALLASCLPAVRATRLDPMVALREE